MCSYFDIRSMSDKIDIINIVEQLRYWFPNENDLIYFSDWLELISAYEIIYIDID